MARALASLLLAVLGLGCASAGDRSRSGDVTGRGSAAPAGPAQPRGPEARVAGPIATDELAALIRSGEVSVLDVRTDVGAYLKDHLPGAVYLHTESLRSSAGGVPNLILPSSSYRTLFSRLGVRLERPVVIYGSGEARNIDATYVAWILAGFGHPAVRVLDGGYLKWQLEERPLTRKYPRVPASRFDAPPFRPERASLEDVRRSIGSRDVVLVDARPPDQYAGEAGAQMRRGHIPGAVNHYWQTDLEGDPAKTWKDPASIRASYEVQGITRDKEVVAYCNGGLESSHVYFTLRAILGYPRVRVYDGSWTEWAEREELPMETGPGRPLDGGTNSAGAIR